MATPRRLGVSTALRTAVTALDRVVREVRVAASGVDGEGVDLDAAICSPLLHVARVARNGDGDAVAAGGVGVAAACGGAAARRARVCFGGGRCV